MLKWRDRFGPFFTFKFNKNDRTGQTLVCLQAMDKFSPAKKAATNFTPGWTGFWAFVKLFASLQYSIGLFQVHIPANFRKGFHPGLPDGVY